MAEGTPTTETPATGDDGDGTTDTEPQEPGQTPATGEGEPLGDGGKAALAAERKAHREAVKRAEAAERKLQAEARKNMDATERAIAEARESGAEEARKEEAKKFGSKLVAAEIRAQIGGRMEAPRVQALLEGLNLPAFLDEDGEVDEAKVKSWVDTVAGKAPAATDDDTDTGNGFTFPDVGQGRRGTHRDTTKPDLASQFGKFLDTQLK